jgi:asparagine synthase (glutamine-hydrolysing)
MCGLAGFLTSTAARRDDAMKHQVAAMTATLVHRGPDASGLWIDAEAGIALGHRRLSILDLSAEGAQPMRSASGRFVISYNGEIYNHTELRSELPEHAFRGRSDTEVLLAAIEAWGLNRALLRSNGMFAFALWDRQERQLHLVRDRLGKKPLYYGWCDGTLLFGSELSALRAYPGFDAEIDRNALATYLRHDYVPAPLCIFKGCYKLRAGTVLTLNSREVADGGNHDPLRAQRKYWDARVQMRAALANPLTGDAASLLDELDRLLRDAVRLRMRSDVPLGAFLSGGIDSSNVVALMQAQSLRRVQTFTIGFDADHHDEAEDAQAVAQALGTDHTQLYVSGEDALAVVPKLPQIFSEPFADSSQIPFYLLAALARRHVTVALSGDGGDELFYGYWRYERALDVYRWRRWLPRVVGSALADVVDTSGEQEVTSDRRIRAADELRAASLAQVYLNRVSRWRRPASVVLGAARHCNAFRTLEDLGSGGGEELMYLDTLTYLPEDILTKVDRATMAVSLEARAPLLDYRIAEFAWRVPFEFKYRDKQQKWFLKQLLYRYLPAALIERPKKGFGAPIGSWLRGPLRDWAAAALDPQRLRREGYFNPTIIGALWHSYLQGKTKLHKRLWSVLMFQSWLESGGGAGQVVAAQRLEATHEVAG